MLNLSGLTLTEVSPLRGIVPEGPIWSESEQCLFWPDIVEKKISKFCPHSQTVEVRQLNFQFSAVALSGSNLVLVANNGLYLFHFESARGKWLIEDANLDSNHRFNDAKVDGKGRLWLGTLRKGLAAPSAGVYHYEAGSGLQLSDTDYTAANGLGWSPCHQYFYIIDTVPQVLYRYEYDEIAGSLSNKTVLIDFTLQKGKPDGMCVDAEGNIWVAMWDGYSVLTYNAQGDFLRTLEVPMPRPTCVTFGGPDLEDLYITTATFGLADKSKLEYPLAGSVLTCRPGVKGLASHQFRLSEAENVV